MQLTPELLDAKTKKPRLFDHWYAWVVSGLLLLVILGILGWVVGFFGHALYSMFSAPLATETVPTPTVSMLPTEGNVSPPIATASLSTATLSTAAPVSTWTPEPTVTPPPVPTLTPTPVLPFFEGPIYYGSSANGRPLYAYRLGTGPVVRALIGGIHGGYEWNTVELVSDTLQYLQDNPATIPVDVTLYIIPCANPDGYAAGTDAVVARMNGNLVDLNRNWDYHWQITATHGTRVVKTGDYAFSEPETKALRDFILEHNMDAVIFYHSAMGVIFSGAEPEKSATLELVKVLSEATGYPHKTDGIYGQITTGDAIDWLSTQGIAGAEIELTTHDRIGAQEWQWNLAGIEAFLNWSLPEVPSAPLTTDSSEWTGVCVVTYTVQPGDVLGQIGLDYDVSEQLLMKINEIENPNEIWVGQDLCIPAPDAQE
ncbi:MAG: LysM peptidoglycan-binding domain-containing protein [Anaerolineae bacterium]|nr:LysM peptidoglycan-binding domain-containing protein [Anaerolineae bacterium]